MMAALNHVELIGYLGNEPEARFTPTGSKVTIFRLAVRRRVKKDDAWQELTEWINIEAWGRLAETCANYLHKGSLAYIGGELRTDRYEDKSGTAKYFTKVVAQQMQMLDRKPAEEPEPAHMAVEEEAAAYAA
jgi:single-strand DNA-binding protein